MGEFKVLKGYAKSVEDEINKYHKTHLVEIKGVSCTDAYVITILYIIERNSK